MDIQTTDGGVILSKFALADRALIDSLFRHVLEESELGRELGGRLASANFLVLYIHENELPSFIELLREGKSDLEQEMAFGGHDAKIASPRESDLLVDLINRLLAILPVKKAGSDPAASAGPE
jgi:hypothetical protein